MTVQVAGHGVAATATSSLQRGVAHGVRGLLYHRTVGRWTLRYGSATAGYGTATRFRLDQGRLNVVARLYLVLSMGDAEGVQGDGEHRPSPP